MNLKNGFTTQGDLLQFTYASFGVLPQKESYGFDFKDTNKKAIQQQLIRLSKEKGHLSFNMGQLIESLSYSLTGYLPNISIMAAIGDVLADIYDSYCFWVRDEGTFLDKTETLRFYITIKVVPLLIVSLNQSLLRYRISDLELETPKDNFWYLPSIDDAGRVKLPLEKVIRWAYEICDTSQTQFHYPEKKADSDYSALQKNLDNAINWTRGASIPALAALVKNFEESFDVMAKCGREVPIKRQISILTMLIFARVSSHAAKKIMKAYDVDFLKDICAQFQNYSQWILDDVNDLKAVSQRVIQKIQSAALDSSVWQDIFSHYWSLFRGKINAAPYELQALHAAYPSSPLCDDNIGKLINEYGRFAVCMCIDLTQRKAAWQPPEGFVDMLIQGFDLKKNCHTNLEQIDEYAAKVDTYGLNLTLCWMEPWLRAIYYYRNGDYRTAMDYYESAFNNAKYRAGQNQYDLVNQYVEVAAKNDMWKCFKKGIEWAQYLGIEIRWLRNDEPTEEKLKYVYEMMKLVSYGHQM
jgi:tetratricopeptide (TPR) repeat protein